MMEKRRSTGIRISQTVGKHPLTGRLILACLFCLACALHASGRDSADKEYYFSNLDIDHGLSQNTVLAILQDSKGFMWFGTKDGLNRYDGTGFRVFKHEDSNPHSLGNNYITELFEDQNGLLWIGTDAGAYVYRAEQDCFSRFGKRTHDGERVKHMVRAITQDNMGRIWLAVEEQGLFCYDTTADSLYLYRPESYIKGLTSNVECLAFDGKGTLWAGFYGQGLYYSDDGMRTLRAYRTEEDEPFADDVVTEILSGAYNCLYVCSLKHGVTEIDLNSHRLSVLLQYDETGEQVYCRELLQTSDRKLWAGTESGLYLLDQATGRLKHLRSDEHDIFALADNAIYSLCQSRDGGIWIGTYFGGVDYYPHTRTYFAKYYPGRYANMHGKRVREFCTDNKGTLWIGTEDGGLHLFDPATGEIDFFGPSRDFSNIHGLCMDGDQLWVGTFAKGLKVIDTRTGRVVRSYTKTSSPRSLADNSIFSICRTKSGSIWLGTLFGLMRYCPQTDDFERIPRLAGKFVYQVKETSDGNLWIGTYADGVYRLDVGRGHWTHYTHQEDDSTSLSYNKVISIFEDSSRRLWFSTQGGGLCLFHPETESFSSFGIADGLPNDVVYQIVEDNRGTLWFTTNNGLVNFDPDKKSVIKTYTTDNGLLCNQFNFCSGFKASDGTIYFGSIEGFVAFDPSTFSESAVMPTPVITDFMLFNKKMYAGAPGSPLKKSITYTDKVELDAGQNSFSLRIAALGSEISQRNPMRYKLENFDKDWITAGKSQLVTYSNLKSGHYTFRVKASDSDGIWSPGECRLHISVRPPFYLSAWAWVAYVLLLAACSTAIFRHFRQRTLRERRVQKEKFEREKEREIYHAKIDFFTNVAHEVRTPLTLIKGPLENILQRKQMDAETREDLNIMQQNTERLLHLTNQLLDFRKTETEGYRLNFAECDISCILQDTFHRFTPLARQKGMDFVLDKPENSVYAHVNEEAFTKIISNLLGNGLKYAATFLHVRLTEDKARQTFSIRTENDGTPVPISLREKIFQPFVRYDGKMTDGTGIGLALARSLAELHRGTLTMETDKQSNVFLLTLPAKQDMAISLPTGKQQEKPQEPSAGTRTFPDGSEEKTDRNTILIVDDNPDMRTFVSRLFAHEYAILNASNGQEALDMLDRHMVSLVVSDVIMPVMDGFELCRRIKSGLDYSHIPVVLLTAKTNMQSKVAGLEIGADAYIEKPFSPEYLQASVHSLISNRDKLRRSFATSPFVTAKTMATNQTDEDFIRKLDEVIRANLSNPDLTTDDMAEALCMSRSNLYRKIKGVVNLSPNEYLRVERLKHAAQLMKEGKVRINEISYMVGFSSPSYFSKCFFKQFGVLPKDFSGEKA